MKSIGDDFDERDIEAERLARLDRALSGDDAVSNWLVGKKPNIPVSVAGCSWSLLVCMPISFGALFAGIVLGMVLIHATGNRMGLNVDAWSNETMLLAGTVFGGFPVLVGTLRTLMWLTRIIFREQNRAAGFPMDSSSSDAEG